MQTVLLAHYLSTAPNSTSPSAFRPAASLCLPICNPSAQCCRPSIEQYPRSRVRTCSPWTEGDDAAEYASNGADETHMWRSRRSPVVLAAEPQKYTRRAHCSQSPLGLGHCKTTDGCLASLIECLMPVDSRSARSDRSATVFTPSTLRPDGLGLRARHHQPDTHGRPSLIRTGPRGGRPIEAARSF